MSLTRSWIAGREAVLAVSKFCLEQGWVFVEVPGQSDFGKDGYVDIATGVGAVTGACFAVQIKGGRSYRRGDGYRIDGTEANRRLWASSTLPVLGIVWDPDEERLAWLDLTAVLNEAGADADLRVPAAQHLGDESAIRKFRKYIGSTAHRAASVLDLASRDVDMQLAAVAASYYIGRTDGRALILLRRLMFNLDRAAQRSAVWALASAIPHPDIFGSAEGSPDPAAEALLEPTLRWSVAEVVDLLSLMDKEGGFDRGTFGQHIYHLLIMDPQHPIKVWDAAIKAAREGATDEAGWALVLVAHWAGENGTAVLDEILRLEPLLGQTWSVPHLAAALAEAGYVAI